MPLALNIATFALLAWSYAQYHGWRTISPLTIFFLFYCIYAGPQSTYISESSLLHKFSDNHSSEKLQYLGAISNSSLTFCPPLHRWLSQKALTLRSKEAIYDKVNIAVVTISAVFAVAFPLILTAIDPSNIRRVTMSVQAMAGESPFTIQQVRRDLFGTTISSQIIAAIRYYVTGPCLVFLLSWALLRNTQKTIILTSATILFLLGFATTHKQTWLYPVAAMLFWLIFCRQDSRGGRSPLSDRIFLASSPAIAVFALTAAYCIQYYSISYPISYWIDIAYTRIFMQSDTLAVAVEHYGSRDHFLGLSGMGPVAELFGAERREPSFEVPLLYNSGNSTTWQNGFLVTGWSIGGYYGVACVSILVSAVAATNSASHYLIRSTFVRIGCAACCSLSLWSLTQMTFSTALFTGGVAGMVFICAAVWALENRRLVLWRPTTKGGRHLHPQAPPLRRTR